MSAGASQFDQSTFKPLPSTPPAATPAQPAPHPDASQFDTTTFKPLNATTTPAAAPASTPGADVHATPWYSKIAPAILKYTPSPTSLLPGYNMGVVKAAAQVPNTLVGWLDSLSNKAADLTGTPHDKPMRPMVEHAEETVLPGVTSSPMTPGEHVGAVGEQLSEWLYGEGEAKAMYEALPLAQRMKKLASVTGFLEKHPELAAKVSEALKSGVARVAGRSAAAGAGTGTQALLHGATPEEAGTAALEGAGGTLTMEGATRAFQVAQEAAVARHAAEEAHAAAPGVTAARTAADTAGRQATAQQGVKDVAQKATQNALDRLNEARQPTTVTRPGQTIPARAGAATIDQGIQSAAERARLGSRGAVVPESILPSNPIVDELGTRAALVPGRIWDQVGNAAQEIEHPPNFAPVDAATTAADTNSFGHGAEKIREAAQPVYTALDQATGGEFAKLQRARSVAYRANDYAKVEATDAAIDDLLKKKPDTVRAADYESAKSAWRDSKVLDRLHNAVENSFNGISEERAAQPGAGPRLLKSGTKEGGSLQLRLGGLLNKSSKMRDEVTRVIGTEGIANLDRASNIVSNPVLAARAQEIADEVAKEFPKPPEPHPVATAIRDSITGAAAGSAIAHGTGLPYSLAAPAGAAAVNTGRYVLRTMVTNPTVGKIMMYAVEHNIPAKAAASAVMNELQRQMADEQEVKP